MNKLLERFGQTFGRMSKDFERTGKPFERVNIIIVHFGLSRSHLHYFPAATLVHHRAASYWALQICARHFYEYPKFGRTNRPLFFTYLL